MAVPKGGLCEPRYWAEAVIVTVPGATAVARPWLPEALLMVAKLEFEDSQVTMAVRSCELPSEKTPRARN